jgi:hypothetical protein
MDNPYRLIVERAARDRWRWAVTVCGAVRREGTASTQSMAVQAAADALYQIEWHEEGIDLCEAPQAPPHLRTSADAFAKDPTPDGTS